MSKLLSFWIAHRVELAGLLGQHVMLVSGSTLAAVAMGVPLGIFSARRPRLAAPLMAAASIVQTIPSLAMFGFLLPVPLVGGVGARAALVVLILYGLLPIVRTTITGLRGVDPVVREAGVAMGMTPNELLRQVELPLALPSIVAGVRVAAVVGVGSATIAAAIGAGGLGEYIYRGLSMVDTTVILAGAIPAALLALAVDGLLLWVERQLSARRRSARYASTAAAMYSGLAAIFKKPRQEFAIEGSVLQPQSASRLWHELGTICMQVGTGPPDQVVAPEPTVPRTAQLPAVEVLILHRAAAHTGDQGPCPATSAGLVR
jgi:osmoprotectant transport system permease protein